ncbi:membrane protein insertion efficiency factor YidD [Winogradskyella forsetii]|uniref:membrane protein insertion efficiency factor YidD n=1 Tax=Winogradskyella forsetii TaxID=2686077 RepID=UPI0015C05066|nr:membrane protein insertion efficiency factor YidD [Winogradskyella forsetii]
MNKTENIEIEENSFEINANEKDYVIIQRHFTKHTKLDLEIQNLPIPKKPIWLNIVVRTLRFYQNNISEKLGNRCVFDPSCSRYSELSFREKGFLRGMSLTINRLKRCRPENGGIDQLN